MFEGKTNSLSLSVIVLMKFLTLAKIFISFYEYNNDNTEESSQNVSSKLNPGAQKDLFFT